MIAPSSSPKEIYENLSKEREREDRHGPLIIGYRKKFKSLARTWWANGEITEAQRDEIVATAQSPAWNHWRPVLYIIPRASIDDARIVSVPHKQRAGYGPELQIADLKPEEFDIVELP